jgi:hypothetical protein
MAMITHVVVEGESDAAILAALITPHLAPGAFHVTAAGGFSPAISLARTYCLDPDVPVALVLDADSVIPEEVRRRRNLVARNLAPYADSDRFMLLFAEPSTEAWLFSGPRATHKLGTAGRTAKAANLDAKRQLQRMLGTDRPHTPADVAKLFKPAELRRAAERQPLSDLVAFIQANQSPRQLSVTAG